MFKVGFISIQQIFFFCFCWSCDNYYYCGQKQYTKIEEHSFKRVSQCKCLGLIITQNNDTLRQKCRQCYNKQIKDIVSLKKF